MIASQTTLSPSRENKPRLTFLGNQGLRNLTEADIASALYELMRRADLHYAFRVSLELSRSGSFNAGLKVAEAFRGGVECTWCKDSTGNSPSVRVLIYLPQSYRPLSQIRKLEDDLRERIIAAQKVLSSVVAKVQTKKVEVQKPRIESVLSELKKLNKIGPFGGVESDDLLLIFSLKFNINASEVRKILQEYVDGGDLAKESHTGYILNVKWEKYFEQIPVAPRVEIREVEEVEEDNSLGSRMKRFRAAHGISAPQLANAAGVNVSVIRCAESNYRLNAKTVKKILKGLEDWIL